MKINLLELFGGVAGFSRGLEQAGFEINNMYYSELDRYANAVTRYNYPNVHCIGDVRKAIETLEDLGVRPNEIN